MTKKKGNRKRRSAEELQRASDHLWYEVWMLNVCAKRLIGGVHDQGIKNAVIESFAIHARALIHFLDPKPRIYPKDVLAEDFFPTEHDWNKNRLTMPSSLDLVRFRVGTEIAHLSYGRQAVVDKTWDSQIAEDLIKVVKLFYELVDKGLLGDRWKKMPWGSPKEIAAVFETSTTWVSSNGFVVKNLANDS